MKPVTLSTLRDRKHKGEKFTCLTAYDATFARAVDEAGIDIILVGDSLGMVLQGHDSTLPVTNADMAYHTASVKRGTGRVLIMADMPFMSYGSVADALSNAAELMRAGAHLVKLEGGAWLAETVTQLARVGIPACVHMGLTPQSVNVFGGYKVQGREEQAQERMLREAREIEAAGAAVLLLECVPSELARRLSEALTIPVIGIGAGKDVDGQVLVLHDLLGMNPRPARFVKNFLADSADGSIVGAFRAYVEAVKAGTFPGAEHGFS